MTQHIRLSQFITTYGPGSLLESIDGPRVISRPDLGLFLPNDIQPGRFEISDQRMSQRLLKGARIFRLPTNAELGKPTERYIYRTKAFPKWKLCIGSDVHRDFNILFNGVYCPMCKKKTDTESIRFIRACSNGHIDDIDWFNMVHDDNANCSNNNSFRWRSGGGTLAEIKIECYICNSYKSLGEAYSQTWQCSGRFPEREDSDNFNVSRCDRSARIIQRQASNLRISEIKTLFSVPPRSTRLHILIENQDIYRSVTTLSDMSLLNYDQFKKTLEGLVTRKYISELTYSEIFRYEWDEIKNAIDDVINNDPDSSYNDLISEEFTALKHASINGAPRREVKAPSVFEVDINRIRKFRSKELGLTFRITPVLKLRTVVVNTGYRREVDTQEPARPVDISFNTEGSDRLWLPGAEFIGEGLFISLDDNQKIILNDSKEIIHNWMQSRERNEYPEFVFRSDKRDELDPVFVWWHTLSHLLIRTISSEAGYSSASIRERVYLENKNGSKNGGILLYATQPGSEGTLGGLIALTPYFGDLLNIALEQLYDCSGDPLCMEQKFRLGTYNGSACYGCLLLSETSCEHRNMWLDRRVILESIK